MQVCDNKYTFLVTTHCPRAQTPVALRSSSGLRRRTRHTHPRMCRTPAVREGEEERQEDQVDGANEHQAGSTAHHRMHLDRLHLYEPGSSPGGANKHLHHLRHVLLAINVHDLEKRPPRCCSPPPSSPLPARHPQTQRALAPGHKQSADPHSGRIERPLRAAGAGEAATAA